MLSGCMPLRRLHNGRMQRRLLSAVLSPSTDMRHGAQGQLLTDMNGGFRALQLKKTDVCLCGAFSRDEVTCFAPLATSPDEGVPTVSSQSLTEARQHVTWWNENFMVNVSMVNGDGEYFCSGLDLAHMRVSNEKKVRQSLEALCQLVAALDASETPVVSVLNGSCIGSGYALAMGKYRFATENSVFFVPEATLGLGLAGGLSYALPRLLNGNQPLALCLALTGMALEGPDLFFTQIATSYMTRRRLDMMTERLAEINQDPRPFGDQTPDCSGDPTAVQTLLERSGELSWNVDALPEDLLNQRTGRIPVTPFVRDLLPQVEQVFTAGSVEEVVDNLRGRSESWAQMALKNIERSSPLSLKVIFEQVKRGGGMDLEQCLDDEFSVNAHLFGLPDFETAMQARESGGGAPAWRCGSLEQVSGDQIAAVFESVPRSP